MITKYQKWAAHTAVVRAVRNGKLTRPKQCAVCGKTPGKDKLGRSLIQAHHYLGYEKQHHLNVKWLCYKCHLKADPRLKRSQHPQAKLTEAQVTFIRRRYRFKSKEFNGKYFSKKFGVHYNTIMKIIKGTKWV